MSEAHLILIENLEHKIANLEGERDMLRDDLDAMKRSLSEAEKDAARWRKFCGLMAFGDFIVEDATKIGPDEECIVIDYIADLERAVDEGSDLRAKAGREDDAHHAPLPEAPKEGTK